MSTHPTIPRPRNRSSPAPSSLPSVPRRPRDLTLCPHGTPGMTFAWFCYWNVFFCGWFLLDKTDREVCLCCAWSCLFLVGPHAVGRTHQEFIDWFQCSWAFVTLTILPVLGALISVRHTPRNGITGLKHTYIELSSEVFAPNATTTSNVWESWLLHILANTWYHLSFYLQPFW